jgi:hypothetical protein
VSRILLFVAFSCCIVALVQGECALAQGELAYVQADMYLNIPPNEDAATPVMDTTTNIENNSRNNEESVNESIECSHEVCVYIYHALTS